MRKLAVVIAAVLVMLIAAVQAQAATIHMHFFESIDVQLQDESFQIFSVSMLQGEKLTVVAYGLEEGVVPGITLLNTVGSTMAEDLNTEGDDVAWVQVDIPENGMYTFLVSRQTEVGGFVRVMAFQGEPIDEDVTLLDDLDPFETSRAFMIGGDPETPLGVTVDLVEPDDETILLPDVFASRGDASNLPTIEDMITPVPVGDTEEWLNNQVTPFYTINIRPFPEIVTTTPFNHDSNSSVFAQIFQVFDYLLIIGQGGEPQRIERDFCLSGDFEVVGITADGEFYQVVDPASESGFRLVPVDTLNVPLDSEGCQRVEEVDVDPPGGTTGGGTGGGTGGFPLPPAGDPPPAGSTGGTGSVNLGGPDNPPGGGTGGTPPSFTVSGFSCNSATNHLVVFYGNAVSSFNLAITYSSNTFNSTLPAAAGYTSVELSDPTLGSGANSFSYVVTDGGGNTIASGTTQVDCSTQAPVFTVSGSCIDNDGSGEFTVFWSGVPAGETQMTLPDIDGGPVIIDNPAPSGSYSFSADSLSWGPGTASLATSGLTTAFPFIDCQTPPPVFTIFGDCFESYPGAFDVTVYWFDGVDEVLNFTAGFPSGFGASGVTSPPISGSDGQTFDVTATYSPSGISASTSFTCTSFGN